jgi:Bacterial mobilisation protein (MobC)
MASATYVAVLVRSHLRKLTPLPTEELAALKRSIGELGAIGRNLNQIARTLNAGGQFDGPGREQLELMLRIAVGLRDHFRALLGASSPMFPERETQPIYWRAIATLKRSSGEIRWS